MASETQADGRNRSDKEMNLRDRKGENLQMEKYLEDRLAAYAASDAYPFHMPGHKRQSLGMGDPYRTDITEIYGFDNLNHPKEVLRELNEDYARLYKTDQAYLMVNGATGGNLAAVFSALKSGDGVLLQRNSHKSIIHALMLKQVHAYYQAPGLWLEDPDIPGLLDPEETEKILELHPDIRLMVVTSPSYEGVLQSIRELSEICHRRNAALVVDAAHGAHLGIFPEFPGNPIQEGADLVVISLHKTLPVMTQTAMVLYRDNPFVNKEDLEDAIRIFQSSSPSYVFMESASRALHFLEKEGKVRFQKWKKMLDSFYNIIGNEGTGIHVLPPEGRDPSKLVLYSRDPSFRGADLMRSLREEDHLELEMAQGNYALAMTSCMDTEEGMKRLTEAILRRNQEQKETAPGNNVYGDNRQADQFPEKVLEAWQVWDRDWEKVPFTVAEGRIARDELCIYPPGIPLVIPGEIIGKTCIEALAEGLRDGLEIDGMDEKREIRVLI